MKFWILAAVLGLAYGKPAHSGLNPQFFYTGGQVLGSGSDSQEATHFRYTPSSSGASSFYAPSSSGAFSYSSAETPTRAVTQVVQSPNRFRFVSASPAAVRIPYVAPSIYYRTHFTPISYGVGYKSYQTGASSSGEVQSNVQSGQAYEAALAAHRRAVEEVKSAQAAASSRHDQAVRKLGGYSEAVVVKTSSSGEAPRFAYTAPVVKTSYATPVVKYAAPVVKTSFAAPVVRTYQAAYTAPVVHRTSYSAPVQTSYGHAKTLGYELLTREEAEYLHRDAIAKQNQIIAGHQASLLGFRSGGGYASSDSSSYERVEDKQQAAADQARFRAEVQESDALLAAQNQEIAEQVAFAKAQGEAARADGDIEYPSSESSGYSGVVISNTANYVPGYQTVDNSAHFAAIQRQQQFSAQQQAIINHQASVIGVPAVEISRDSSSAETGGYVTGGYVAGGVSVGTPYTGPKITAEETFALHREAIEKQKAIVRQHEQSIAAAKSDSSSETSGYAYSSPAHVVRTQFRAPVSQAVSVAPANFFSFAAPTSYRYSAPVSTYSFQKTVSGAPTPYAGPFVTREQTEELHKDAISKQRQIIAEHQSAISAAESRLRSGDDSQEQTYQTYQTYQGPQVTRQQAFALHSAAIAKQNALVNQQKASIAHATFTAPSSDEKVVTSYVKSAPVHQSYVGYAGPVQQSYSYSAPAVVQTRTSYAPYSGPQVTAAETYALHREAIDKQNQIIAQQKSFLAQQKMAISQHQAFTKSAAQSSDESGGYAGSYMSSAYVSPVTSVVKSYVASPGQSIQSYFSSDNSNEQALLAQQAAEVQRQNALAKAQGKAESGWSSAKTYTAPSSSGSSGYSFQFTPSVTSYTSQSPYFYYRYANPIFSGNTFSSRPAVFVDNVKLSSEEDK